MRWLIASIALAVLASGCECCRSPEVVEICEPVRAAAVERDYFIYDGQRISMHPYATQRYWEYPFFGESLMQHAPWPAAPACKSN